jgi:regulator of protease activity HflC (stomatin/prohibitin superfamily)
MIRRVRIDEFEKGLVFQHGELIRLLDKGRYWILNLNMSKRIEVVSTKDIYLMHRDLDIIAQSGLLKDRAIVLDIKDTQRALVWKNGRFDSILPPGFYVLWNKPHQVQVEIVDTEKVLFQHEKLETIVNKKDTHQLLDIVTIDNAYTGLVFINGELEEQLKPGVHAFWKNAKNYTLYRYDTRENILDIAGQDIITADKVTLRLNTVISYQVVDAHKAAVTAGEVNHSLYREAQLALRAVIGTHELDCILQEKDMVTTELETIIKKKAVKYGLQVNSLGIRDIILPGEMKDLLNRVTEAKKVAEANIISRREEVAAMRSQANTAKMLENNATLMKLKELEVLEKIAARSNLNVILGDKKLTEAIINLV